MAPVELQKQITSGSLIKNNDKIKLKTNKGEIHQFVVTKVTNTHVQGKNQNIPIDAISSIAKVETSVTKTAGLTVALIGIAVVAFAYTIVSDTVDEIER